MYTPYVHVLILLSHAFCTNCASHETADGIIAQFKTPEDFWREIGVLSPTERQCRLQLFRTGSGRKLTKSAIASLLVFLEQ
jgi:hypothetical protein